MAREWRIKIYATADGQRPFESWAEALASTDSRALVAAIEGLLVPLGPGVCATPWGRRLGHGLFELRIGKAAGAARKPPLGDRAETRRVLLRVFCHAYGDRLVLLLGGYDKLRQPKKTEQSRQIKLARQRLADFKRRQPRHGG